MVCELLLRAEEARYRTAGHRGANGRVELGPMAAGVIRTIDQTRELPPRAFQRLMNSDPGMPSSFESVGVIR
jgi:hypothetical protein